MTQLLWHAFALLCHGGDRIGLRPWISSGGRRPLRNPDQVLRTLDRLDEAVWTANALAAAVESGLIRRLGQSLETQGSESHGVRAEELAGTIGAPPPMAEALVEILVGLGFVHRRDGWIRVAPGFEPFTSQEGVEAFAAALRAPQLQGEDLCRRARSKSLDLEGWRFEDTRIIEAQGALTALWVNKAAPKLRFLPGLMRSLERPGAMLLDVGAGAGGLSIALCRRFPNLRAVALEPAPCPAEVGERHVTDAELQERIEIRRQRVEDLTDEQRFDLAFLPQMFLPDSIIEATARCLFRALKPGGWILVAVLARPGADVAAAVTRLKNMLWGGNARGSNALKPLLVDTGFRPVIRAPGGDAIRMICARRPPRAALPA